MDFVVGNEPFRGKSRTLENPAPSKKRTASSRAKALVGRGPDVALTVVRPWTAPSWGKGLAPVSELDRGDGNESPGK